LIVVRFHYFLEESKTMISNALLSTPISLIKEDGSSIDLNPFEGYGHLAIIAGTRSGRYHLASDIFTHVLAAGIPIFALDYPDPNGKSVLLDRVPILEEHCNELLLDGDNLFELPDLMVLDAFSREEARRYFVGLLEKSLLAMVLGNNTDASLGFPCKSVLGIALSRFFDNPSIQARYEAAFKGGVASEDWAKMPTLKDFVPFCQAGSLGVDDKYKDKFILQACDIIALRLEFWLNSRLRRAIASPSRTKTDSKMQVFSVGNPANADEAFVLQSVALLYVIRAASTSPRSMVFVNEASSLCKSSALSELLGSLCAQGPKLGIRVVLMAHDIESIANSKGGERILQNIGTSLIGRVEQDSIPSLVTALGLPLEIVKSTGLQTFSLNKKEGYSNWLISHDGDYSSVRHYPNSLQLVIPEER
jgi:hypothetical protein